MNGDTFNNLNFIDVVRFKKRIHSPVIVFGSYACKIGDDDYGFIHIDKNNLALEFLKNLLLKIKNEI